MAAAMGAVGVGLVDCHCHLSDPDFDRVCEGEVGPVGAGRPPFFPFRLSLFSSLRAEPQILPGPPSVVLCDLLLTPYLISLTLIFLSHPEYPYPLSPLGFYLLLLSTGVLPPIPPWPGYPTSLSAPGRESTFPRTPSAKLGLTPARRVLQFYGGAKQTKTSARTHT